MPAPVLPVTYPVTLSSTDPDGAVETCRLLDDRIRELRQQMALLFGIPLDTPIGSAVGVINITNALVQANSILCEWTSNTQYTLGAFAVLITLPSGAPMVVYRPPNVVVDLSIAGPAPGGRDSAATFGPNAWCYLYWIYNGATDTHAGIASLNSPTEGGPSGGGGPMLPAGYTRGPFMLATRIGLTANQFVRTNTRGKWTTYYALPRLVSTTSTGLGQVPVDFSLVVPPNAVSARFNALLTGNVGGPDMAAIFRDSLGATLTAWQLPSQVSVVGAYTMDMVLFGQQMTYEISAGTRTGFQFIIDCVGYENP
jgi:hypothetical protein